jgi:hypothetical protein
MLRDGKTISAIVGTYSAGPQQSRNLLFCEICSACGIE